MLVPWGVQQYSSGTAQVVKLFRFAELDDQVEACRRVFASDTRWSVVRGSDLEEGESEGLPVGSTQTLQSLPATMRSGYSRKGRRSSS